MEHETAYSAQESQAPAVPEEWGRKTMVEPHVPDVDHALNDLEKQVVYLSERLAALADRLLPIVRPASPAEAPEFADYSSPLGQRIANSYRQLSVTSVLVDDLHNRLEI